MNELAQQLGVSGMTVRRDLRYLEKQGTVRVVHGGASLPHGTLRSSFVARAEGNAGAKRSMAQQAVRLIEDQDAVALDAGTTAYEVAVALPDTFAGVLVTHSVPVIQLLLGREDIRVIGLGGDLLHASQAFVGSITVEAAQRLRVRTFFLAAAAVDHRGVYVEADSERPTKLALIDIADQVILLADHTKFTRSAPVLLCPLDKIDVLITDQTAPTTLTSLLKKSSCRLIIATPGRSQTALR